MRRIVPDVKAKAQLACPLIAIVVQFCGMGPKAIRVYIQRDLLESRFRIRGRAALVTNGLKARTERFRAIPAVRTGRPVISRQWQTAAIPLLRNVISRIGDAVIAWVAVAGHFVAGGEEVGKLPLFFWR